MQHLLQDLARPNRSNNLIIPPSTPTPPTHPHATPTAWQEYYQGIGGTVGLLLAVAGTRLPGSEVAIAEGNTLGRGPIVFHLPQVRAGAALWGQKGVVGLFKVVLCALRPVSIRGKTLGRGPIVSHLPQAGPGAALWGVWLSFC